MPGTGGGPRLTERQKQRYVHARFTLGLTRSQAAKQAKISYKSAQRLDTGVSQETHAQREAVKAAERLPGPILPEDLCDRAKRGLEDFEFFRRVYLGHPSLPWAVETAETVVAALDSPHKTYIVENCPPGVGKSTLIHDIAVWVTVRNRRIRGLFGSRTQSNADRLLRRVRRTLERATPYRAPDEQKAAGVACDAEATIAQDYGLFRPVTADTWRGDEFIVAQHDDLMIEEKEPTWSSYGMDSGVLGNRFNIIFWDDVVDKTTIRTMEATENQRQWWDEEGETRLEPGGVLFLVGQRMAANDLYRYALDKKVPVSEEDMEEAEGLSEEEQLALSNSQPSMYQHINYLAHYEDRCQGRASHGPDALPYPDGCLLDPYRIPWRDCYNTMHSKPQTWSISYQQEDTDPDSVLVRKVWVYGGTCPDEGTLHPGCVDEDRGLLELPKGLQGPLISLATVDPSPTKFWAIQWWIYTPNAGNQLWLLDGIRRQMGGNELLDWNLNEKIHYGVMEDWQARSVRMGLPITTWVVEINAAQRFLLQYQFISAWQRKWGVNIKPHQTTVRKLDVDLGMSMTRDWWRFGRIRLPYKPGDEGRLASLKLIDEATKWPKGWSDDQVMAHWFAITHLPKISAIPTSEPTMRRPAVARGLPDYRRHLTRVS